MNTTRPILLAAVGLLAVIIVIVVLWPAGESTSPPAGERPTPAPVGSDSPGAVAAGATAPTGLPAGEKRPVPAAPVAGTEDAPAVEAGPPPEPVRLEVVPRPVRMSRREALGYTNSLRTAVLHYQRDNGSWPEPAGPCPAEPPAGEAVPWEGDCRAGFDQLHWEPPAGEDGVPMTRCSYEIEILAADTGRDGGDFRVIARCDGDGDGVISETVASRHAQARRRTDDEIY